MVPWTSSIDIDPPTDPPEPWPSTELRDACWYADHCEWLLKEAGDASMLNDEELCGRCDMFVRTTEMRGRYK